MTRRRSTEPPLGPRDQLIERVVTHRKQGLTSFVTSKRIGCGDATVKRLIHEARVKGIDVPKRGEGA